MTRGTEAAAGAAQEAAMRRPFRFNPHILYLCTSADRIRAQLGGRRLALADALPLRDVAERSAGVRLVIAERSAGVRLVIAESFERIYRQNADNLGLFTSTDFDLIWPGGAARSCAFFPIRIRDTA